MKRKIKSFVKPITRLADLSHGWGNGYACIPPGHPMFGIDYSDIDVEVHYGLTFGDNASAIDWPEIPKDCKDCYIVGFDTCHYQDGPHLNQQWVEDEAEKLAKQLSEMW